MPQLSITFTSPPVLHSTPGQLREFFTSTLWQDIQVTVATWREDIRDALEIVEPNDLHLLQGAVIGLEKLLSLPGYMMEPGAQGEQDGTP